MDKHAEDTKTNQRPDDVARREVLKRGARLAYVVPAVLAALSATPASAQVSGPTS